MTMNPTAPLGHPLCADLDHCPMCEYTEQEVAA